MCQEENYFAYFIYFFLLFVKISTLDSFDYAAYGILKRFIIIIIIYTWFKSNVKIGKKNGFFYIDLDLLCNIGAFLSQSILLYRYGSFTLLVEDHFVKIPTAFQK